jgi:hypothetical protein
VGLFDPAKEDSMTEHTPAREAVEGQIIPAGHTLGIPARLADDATARDVYAALVAAGHTPAELSNETDDDDTDTARGTGFLINVREGGWVQVYHLVSGVDSWHALSDSDRRAVLRAYRNTLRDAGWQYDGRIFRCVHVWRTSPLPQGVTAAQTRGEKPEPVKVRMTPQPEALARIQDKAAADREAHRAEMDEREAAEARAHGVPVRPAVLARIAARNLPEAPEGCRFEVTHEHGRTIVRMFNSVTAAPEFEAWTYHAPDSDVVPAYAREMARVYNNAMAETRALLALDDATMYRVATSAGEVETMDGRAARARLQSYREQAGPEKLHGRNTPRVTLKHSGAHWLLTVHAYRNGNADFRNNLRVEVQPVVTAEAAHALAQGTGSGIYMPMERLGTGAFGPWVRAVEGAPDRVRINWVTCGVPVRPEEDGRASKHAEVMSTYRGAMEAAGWTFQGATEDGGMEFQYPAHVA